MPGIMRSFITATTATTTRNYFHIFVISAYIISWYLSYSGVEGVGGDVNIDLRRGVVGGYNPHVSFLHRPTKPTNGSCNSQAVLRISFPASNSGLRLRLTYGNEVPRLWTLHVSDSPTGNGFGGDDNTTSNNAELNVHNKQMRLYGNQLPSSIDAAMNGGRLIKVYDDFVRQGSKVTIEISDERFEWKGTGMGDIIESPFLFTMAGQNPVFGSRDEYIYVGLNRIVSGGHRTGSGLCHAGIKVHQPPQHCSKGTHNCHKDAICTDTRKSFRCYCKPGFHGDGRVCKDEDECDYESGGCVHQCVNTPGSFHCACQSGFKLMADKKNCIDINECFTNKGGCSHQCINSIGSYDCGCGKGYTLNSNGKTCVHEEWCHSEFGCDHGCQIDKVDKKVKCYCREGYYPHSNGKTCLRSCFHGNGGCHHVCTDTGSGPKCSCSQKYFLNGDKKTCTASCAVSNGGCESICSDTSGGTVCSCPQGFKLHQDGRSCLDINECASGVAGCSHQCENTKGSFECVCPEGYKVSADRKTCVDIDECQLKTTCDHECVNVPGSFQCNCNKGYQKFGVTHCADKDECADRNGGCGHLCSNTDGGYRCSCVPGFKLHPNDHDCIDARQCTKLRPRPDIDLSCRSSHGEQNCSLACKGQGYLVTGGMVMNDDAVNITCGPSTKYEWLGLDNEILPECSKHIVPPSYKRMARLVIQRESCDVDEKDLEEARVNLTNAFNSEKKYKCSNRCRVNYFDLMCGSRRKKFKKLMRRSKKYIMTAEFGLEMKPKKNMASCDAFCSAQKNRKRFMRAFKRLRQLVKRRKFSVRVNGKDYRAVKKSLKTDKRIIAECPSGTELTNGTCVGCLPGTSFSKKTKDCQPCSKGTYQDNNGQLECKICPDRILGSGREAAAALEDCYDMCEPGTFSSSGTKPCQHCGIGTFQPQFGRITCVPCGGGLSTTMTGSKDFSQCISRVICKPGSFYSTVSHACVTCRRGFYQPRSGQEYCKACPGNTTTDFPGATSPKACKDRTCGQHKGDYYGILESPNYPGNYPVNVECVWKIRPEKKRRILIIVPEIDLSDGDQCGDVIVMRKSKSPYSQSTFETCESRPHPIAFTARSKKLYIQFKSDSNNTAKGFSIPFVTYNDEYQTLIEDIVKDGRLYSSKQHQKIFQDRQLLSALLEVIATPYTYLKYVNVSHTMFPPSFFSLLTPKVERFFRT